MTGFNVKQCIWRDQCDCHSGGCEYYTPYDEDDYLAARRLNLRKRREAMDEYAYTYYFENEKGSDCYNF